MAQNPTPSLLDAGQMFRRTFDQTNDAIRVEVGGGTSFALSLDSNSGDTVGVQGVATVIKQSITTANTGVIVPAFSCVGMKSFQLYTNTTSAITGAQVCTLQVSPSDTDNVWVSTTLTITPSTGTGAVMATANSSIVARRARVSIAAAVSAGAFDIYVNANGN